MYKIPFSRKLRVYSEYSMSIIKGHELKEVRVLQECEGRTASLVFKIHNPDNALLYGEEIAKTLIEDGKVYIPIPLQMFKDSHIDLTLPVTIASLTLGGILIFNPHITNPDFLRSTLKMP